MSSLISESTVFGGIWTSAELRAIFDEVPRTAAWLEVLAVLAETEASFGLIPEEGGAAAASACRSVVVDAAFLDEVRVGYERSGHSLVGLLEAVGRRAEGSGAEWLCYGATVQDITDTWLMLALAEVRAILARDLAALDDRLAALAREHRTTPMAGRTHGQIGLPITFGFKVAGWLVELRRHRDRLQALDRRMGIGQLAGGVGSLSSFGPRGPELQAAFLERLGLAAPTISWTASRDILAEWCGLLTLASATADRIGHEVVLLGRSEVGELSEGLPPGNVGSITMPHKRNPELAEHLGTLARIARHSGNVVFEGLVHDHERDGRSWKAEWLAVPQATIAAVTAIGLLCVLVDRLEVHPERMRANLAAAGGVVATESLMLELARRLGKASAHRLVHETTTAAAEDGIPVRDALVTSAEIGAVVSPARIAELLDADVIPGHCVALVDRVLAPRADGVR